MGFRGGSITVPLNAPVANAVSTARAVVKFVALECVVKQEKEDEVASEISLFVPSKALKTYKFSDWHMGKQGVRTWPVGTDNVFYETNLGPRNFHFRASPT
jgi:hypothetical protein